MTRDEFMEMVYDELHSDGDNYRANRIIDAADEYAETEKESDWIPVSERLPEKEMNCLVTDNLGKVHKVTFYHALDGRESYFSGCYCVRAWMSSPEPYRE